ncbi:hypothetical protein RSOLAG1IB_01171 [Rhizoctonia solani AG-1 IB]|uniref:GST N-terminal domain-containing protein n=1 Tax=Thanatephorus cucumeris (strain AG1-IB / isolate 7/3/14) TaxID=1108050 RepID=M5BTZ1_THACB|nr:hypothetical protein BN14_04704 [Rhizoctonia solani AG-1 IB]CEL55163.1 hypothetical protein RSOLAG1IB_01171 [Rhizoctonia solani AG-1 IB]
MAATKENPITFYDILSQKDGSWSPYTYRTRLTLNYKGLPYRVEYLSYPDIEPTLSARGMDPVSNAFPRYILPVIEDPSEDPNGRPTFVADSFNIAVYLDAKYPAPNYPLAIPPGTRSLQKIFAEQFNNEVGFALVPIALPLISKPGFLDEPGRGHFIRTRTTWFGDLSKLLDTSPEKWAVVEEKWNKFSQAIDHNGSSEAGPFVMGKQISFADFTIGGIINWLRKVDEEGMPRWKHVSEWDGGRWARYWDEVEKFEKNSTEVV